MAIWLKGRLVLFWSYDKHRVFAYLYDTDKVKKKANFYKGAFILTLSNIEYLSCTKWREGAMHIIIDPTLKVRDKWKHLLLTLELAYY